MGSDTPDTKSIRTYNDIFKTKGVYEDVKQQRSEEYLLEVIKTAVKSKQ